FLLFIFTAITARPDSILQPADGFSRIFFHQIHHRTSILIAAGNRYLRTRDRYRFGQCGAVAQPGGDRGTHVRVSAGQREPGKFILFPQAGPGICAAASSMIIPNIGISERHPYSSPSSPPSLLYTVAESCSRISDRSGGVRLPSCNTFVLRFSIRFSYKT